MEDGVPGDASTLIYLAKADAFEDVSAIVARVLVSPAVWWEAVDEGERIRAPDVVRIREAAGQGSLVRVELSSGERALAHSRERKHGRASRDALEQGAGATVVPPTGSRFNRFIARR